MLSSASELSDLGIYLQHNITRFLVCCWALIMHIANEGVLQTCVSLE